MLKPAPRSIAFRIKFRLGMTCIGLTWGRFLKCSLQYRRIIGSLNPQLIQSCPESQRSLSFNDRIFGDARTGPAVLAREQDPRIRSDLRGGSELDESRGDRRQLDYRSESTIDRRRSRSGHPKIKPISPARRYHGKSQLHPTKELASGQQAVAPSMNNKAISTVCRPEPTVNSGTRVDACG